MELNFLDTFHCRQQEKINHGEFIARYVFSVFLSRYREYMLVDFCIIFLWFVTVMLAL